MGLPPHRHERPPKATPEELLNISRNLSITSVMYGLSLESYEMAVVSAQTDRDRAARCYAAILRSL